MQTVVIISSSVRNGRNSHRVSLFFEKFLAERGFRPVMADLDSYNFPVFTERLKYLEEAPAGARELAALIKEADGVLIVSPEYNGGYPASLKNVIDLYYDEWKRKPVAISTVSTGAFGGSQVITSLQFVLWKIGALTVPAMFPVASVEKSFDESGMAIERESTEKRAEKFIAELKWCMDASQNMK